MTGQITVYADYRKASPFTDRVELALREAGAKYTVHTIDLKNKPSYYTEKINPRGKVPAITYGGPDVPPDQPSAESFKLAESLVILEFIADLFPASGLLPSDPIERAKVRFFVDATGTVLQPAFLGFLRLGDGADVLIAALKEVQSLLTSGAQLAVGNKFTIADAALAPWLYRLELALEDNIGAFTETDRKRVSNAYDGETLRVLREYFSAIKSRKSFKESVTKKEILGPYYASVFKKSSDKA